jgi:hypothetical protein
MLCPAITDRGGFEEVFRGMFEDQVFHVKFFLKRAAFVASECWWKYRKHPDSCVSRAQSSSVEYYSARLNFLVWVETYLLVQGVTDKQVWKVLREQLRSYRHPVLDRCLKARRRFVEKAKQQSLKLVMWKTTVTL